MIILNTHKSKIYCEIIHSYLENNIRNVMSNLKEDMQENFEKIFTDTIQMYINIAILDVRKKWHHLKKYR